MKIVILSTSDSVGGAAVVSKRLMEAFCSEGHEASLVVLNKGDKSSDTIISVSPCGRAKLPFYLERLQIFSGNGFNRNDLFKVSTASTGVDVAKIREVRDADVIILGWINQGFLSLKEIKKIGRLGKPIIWTMHDMWCMTGICHLPGMCKNYEDCCGWCHYLHGMSGPHDLSWKGWRRKDNLYNELSSIRFVAVSNWLATRAKESSLLGKKFVRVINNPYDIPSVPCLNTQRRNPVIVMGAARLDEDVKNLPLAIESLNRLYKERGVDFPGLKAVFYGKIRNQALFDSLVIPFEWKGEIRPDDVPAIFNNARVVMSSSRFEMLPTTIVEGVAWGCCAVATDNGGQSDIIMEGKNGFLCTSDAKSLADALAKALEMDATPEYLRSTVSERFSPRAVAHEYMKIIGEML